MTLRRPFVRPSVCPFVCDKLKHWQLLGHYLQQSYESWPKGSPWGDLQNDMTLGDLDLCIYWKFGKMPFLNIFDNISDTIHSRVMRHGPKVAWGETLKRCDIG